MYIKIMIMFTIGELLRNVKILNLTSFKKFYKIEV